MYLFVVETLFVSGFTNKNQQMLTTTPIFIKQSKNIAAWETERSDILKLASLCGVMWFVFVCVTLFAKIHVRMLIYLTVSKCVFPVITTPVPWH